jgi:hypothetical protein
MNAPVSAEIFASESRNKAVAAHFFRSRFLDKWADVETWAVGRLRAGNPQGKLPPTLGLRLGAVRKLTETYPALFKKAAAVAELLDDLRSYQELRSTVAHAKLISERMGQMTIHVFHRPDANADMPWCGRVALREQEFCQIMARLSDLANQLDQQTPA